MVYCITITARGLVHTKSSVLSGICPVFFKCFGMKKVKKSIDNITDGEGASPLLKGKKIY